MKKFITGIRLLGCAAAVAGIMFCFWGYGMLADTPKEMIKENNNACFTYKEKMVDMICSGQKKEEYREIKPYYRSRFKTLGLLDEYSLPVYFPAWVILRNGYSANSPEVEVKVACDIKEGNPEWGAESEKEYYVLRIMERKERL